MSTDRVRWSSILFWIPVNNNMEQQASCGAETAIDIRANTHGGWTLDGEYVPGDGDGDKKRGWTRQGESIQHRGSAVWDMEQGLKRRWVGVPGLDGSL